MATTGSDAQPFPRAPRGGKPSAIQGQARDVAADYARDPVVERVLGGLRESNPHAREPVNPSIVAAIAEAAYRRFPGGRIGGVMLSPDGRSAFVVPEGQRLLDPDSERERICLVGAAERPFDEAWWLARMAMQGEPSPAGRLQAG